MKLTILINYQKDIAKLVKTLKSITGADPNWKNEIRIMLLVSSDLTTVEQNRLEEFTINNSNISEVIVPEGNIWRGFEWGISNAQTPYVMMIKAGDIYLKNSLKTVLDYFNDIQDATDVLAMNGKFGTSENSIEPSFNPKESALYHIDKRENICEMPMTYNAAIFKTGSVQNELFDERHGIDTWEEYVYRIIDKKKTLGYVAEDFMIDGFSKVNPRKTSYNTDKDWYLGVLRVHCTLLIESYQKKYGNVPLFIQYRLLYNLKIRFLANKSRENKNILNDEELSVFFDICKMILNYIDDSLLIAAPNYSDRIQLTYALQYYFLSIKYGEKLNLEYFLEHTESEPEAGLYAKVNGRKLPNRINANIRLDVTNYENGYLIFDFSAPNYLWNGNIEFQALFNDKEIEIEKTIRYTKVNFFGQEPYQRYTFRVKIQNSKLQKKNRFRFCIKQSNEVIYLPITSGRYPSRITSKLPYSYWCFGKYMLFLTEMKKDGVKNEITIEKSNFLKHLKREILFLCDMPKPEFRAKKACLHRILYWVTYPVLHRKNIWLTYDKLYKGGDCGEYFYKYMVSRKDSGVVPQYVINLDAADRIRLEEEGYTPLIHGSLKHRMYYLHSKMIFATHAGIYDFNGISKKELPFFQDLLNADATCIQHGLTVQYLAFNANRAYNNNKRYYCASKYEIQNLLAPDYGYDDESVIRLTGIPRYDGLVNNDKRQILITPTWRSYIALPQLDKSSMRPYSPDFKNTDYFRIYNNLISDKRLVETARKTGYKLIYLIHPAVSQQIRDYTIHEGVEIISALDINYEKILNESSLMVTDYSGVQFDFAYMRKPIVYYHPKELPPHYQEGGFFYDKQGFGEICEKNEEIVDCLCDYMERDCALKPFYKNRQDDFFEYDDSKNCQRIFEDALAFQKAKGTYR